MTARLLFIHALSPLHVGTGQSLGAVDLAIARDKATGFPVLPGSGLKGALRDKARCAMRSDVQALFGPETANAADHAGGLVFGDANLLCLPVRSVAGTFAWVTSQQLLRRFARDCREVGQPLDLGSLRFPNGLGQCLVGAQTSLVVGADQVVFEDLDLKGIKSQDVSNLASRLSEYFLPEMDRAVFAGRFCIVHDDVMSFLSEHATDVVTRVSLEAETKTARQGALWTEENLPTETLLVSVVLAQPNAQTGTAAALLGSLAEVVQGSTQLGGKRTVGRGRVALSLVPPGAGR